MGNSLRLLRAVLGCICLMMFLMGYEVRAAGQPKIAVTDLTYEEKVSSYFTYFEAHEKTRERSDDSFYSSHSRSQSDRSVVATSGQISWIERGELHKFTGDIKGALLKSSLYRVTQGRPWSPKGRTTLFDIIGRIKNGLYPGADYVLFGTITSIESRNESIDIQATNATNHILAMELLVDFSLINTKTYEVTAGFSALGEGSDQRLANSPGTRVSLSRGRVMSDVSHSLAEAVLSELESQFAPMSGGRTSRSKDVPFRMDNNNSRENPSNTGRIITYQ
ncbi:MAG: hypothetical protein WCK65_00225 [Rhodospirillaceae bacterium]